jgi:hypothetical protein
MYEKPLNSTNTAFERMPLLPCRLPPYHTALLRIRNDLFDPDPDPTYQVIPYPTFQIFPDPDPIQKHCQVEKVLTVQ